MHLVQEDNDFLKIADENLYNNPKEETYTSELINVII